MIRRLSAIFQGDALRARAMRGAMMTFVNFGGSQALRLGSNLILTRLLFPEAFGLMALVQVFTVGLQMFSDIGLQTSVVQNKRGDDPAFLDTAWTLQVGRGVILWLAAWGLAYPVAAFYEQPELSELLPVVGLNAAILGLSSVNVLTASRHINLTRLTWLELGSQLIGVIVMVVLAMILQSVWALVFGGLVGSAVKAGLTHVVLPGRRSRFGFERAALSELFHFGKWIFVGTVAGFLVQHGDRAILGKYITLTELAFYNIGFFLATVPEKLNQMLVTKVLFPLYVQKKPAESTENRTKVLRARGLLMLGGLGLSLPLILFGDPLIAFLYDPRYHAAGPILVMICLARLLSLVTASYGSVLLANGASKTFAGLALCSAVLRTGMMLVGAIYFGIPGVIFGILIGQMLTYPLFVATTRPYQAWAPGQDLALLVAGVALGALIWSLQPEMVASFLDMARPATAAPSEG